MPLIDLKPYKGREFNDRLFEDIKADVRRVLMEKCWRDDDMSPKFVIERCFSVISEVMVDLFKESIRISLETSRPNSTKGWE